MEASIRDRFAPFVRGVELWAGDPSPKFAGLRVLIVSLDPPDLVQLSLGAHLGADRREHVAARVFSLAEIEWQGKHLPPQQVAMALDTLHRQLVTSIRIATPPR